jgi:hypothetical protein
MGIGSHHLEPYGDAVAKIKLEAIEELEERPLAKYVVVSAITPTPLGEGKTTTTVGRRRRAAGHSRGRRRGRRDRGAARLAREGTPNLRGDAVAAALLAKAGVRAAAALVEINTTAGEISDDRVERAGELVASAGAARLISEGNG